MARAGVRGVDRTWIRNLYGFAIAPHLVFYLKIDEKTLIQRVLQSRGMDYWESGMDLKLGDDIYESFRAYQKALLREYGSMADEFNFRMLDARRKVEVIQDELRRQIGGVPADGDGDGDGAERRAFTRIYTAKSWETAADSVSSWHDTAANPPPLPPVRPPGGRGDSDRDRRHGSTSSTAPSAPSKRSASASPRTS